MPKLVKSAFQKVKFTNAQIQELKNCANDPVYMLQNFAHVLHPTKGEIPFHLFEYQKEMVSAFHQYRNIVILSGRQLGKTECAVGYLLWYAMFKPGSTILVAANNYRQALEIMKRIRFIYESLPDHIRAGSKYYAIERIEFDNGSTIEAQATTENTGRGKSISVLYLDEFDFVPINIATDFWTSISATLSTGGQCIITSTPNNSDGPFAQIWRAANDNLDEYGNLRASKIGKNGFFALEFPWHRHPDRDEKWAEEQRAKLGEDRFLREHCCRFITKDETLINGMLLETMFGVEPKFKEGEIRYYEPLKPNFTYIVTLDPSSGVGRDASAIQVLQLPDLRQVAEWRSENTDIKGQVSVMLKILHKIHRELKINPHQISDPQIYWTFENNGGYGDAVMMVVNDTGEDLFPGEFIHEPKRAGSLGKRFGLNTSERKKLTACMRLKSLVESDRIKLFSMALIREMKSFVAKGDSFAAKSGAHDDLISAVLLAIRIMDIVQQWDEDFGQKLKEIVDSEEYDVEPLPISFM